MHDGQASRPGDGSDGSPPSEAWLFAQAIQGKPIPIIVPPEARASAERRELERLAPVSSTHAESLRQLDAAEGEARRERELLEWAAKISDHAAAKLRAIEGKDAAERDARRRAEEFAERLIDGRSDAPLRCHSDGTDSVIITEYDPNQPRQPKGTPEAGQWAPKGGGAAGGGSGRWYLPSDDKGTWLGKKAKALFV